MRAGLALLLISLTACGTVGADHDGAPGGDDAPGGGADASGGGDDASGGGGDGAPAGADAGSGSADAGPPECPARSSVAVFDVSTLGCDELTARWVEAVGEAKTCGCDADCSLMICESPCCNCPAWVSPMNDAYREVEAIQSEWNARTGNGQCPFLFCTDVFCISEPASSCGSSSDGTRTVCQN